MTNELTQKIFNSHQMQQNSLNFHSLNNSNLQRTLNQTMQNLNNLSIRRQTRISEMAIQETDNSQFSEKLSYNESPNDLSSVIL